MTCQLSALIYGLFLLLLNPLTIFDPPGRFLVAAQHSQPLVLGVLRAMRDLYQGGRGM